MTALLQQAVAIVAALPPAEQDAAAARIMSDLSAGRPAADYSPVIEPGREYPVWSPHSDYAAAATLLAALEQPS